MRSPPRPDLSWLAPWALIASLLLSTACSRVSEEQSVSQGETASPTPPAPAVHLPQPPASVADAFDFNPAPEEGFRVVGSLRPAQGSWGKIELLEGLQTFRREGYNRRTEKLRDVDTFESGQYPVRRYFGALNQQVVDGFNLFYRHPCAQGLEPCPDEGPTRPAARLVLLHQGPRTDRRECEAEKTPVLLVHGAMQDANVWLFPTGEDGTGHGYPGTPAPAGMVRSLEEAGRCTYAVTFGNFHGDNYSQATQLANALARILELHPAVKKVDVIAWSKGVLAADAYLSNAARWQGFNRGRYFEAVAAEQAARVPSFRSDVRVYVALSGPHLGIDLNFRHPIHTLTIASTPFNAPVGRGPMTWTSFAAIQCANALHAPWLENPYASSLCKDRGGAWADYFGRVYVSNLEGLGPDGRPRSSRSLLELNVGDGLSAGAFAFDEYNVSLFGSVDAQGRMVSPYLGQLQAANDLRRLHPIPRRDSPEWRKVDADEERWYPWVASKLLYSPFGWPAGRLLDAEHRACRTAAFEPTTSPCLASHSWTAGPNSEGLDALGRARYRLFDGLGIETAIEMGGRFIERLTSQGLDPRLESLYVLHGEGGGAAGTTFETDGMACPGCAPQGDGVLFRESVAAMGLLTEGWSPEHRLADARQEGLPLGHLEVGASQAVAGKILAALRSRD